MDINSSIKVYLALGASIIAIASFAPYFHDVLAGKTKPHLFSWLIWGILTTIGFAGQLAEGAGPGMWVTGVSALCVLLVILASMKHGQCDITLFDWGCLILSVGAIPLWIITATPLWSMILITLIDAVGFLPTIRKSYHRPYEETSITYSVAAFKYSVSIIALDKISLVTTVYPLSLVIMNVGFVAMLYYRRKILTKVSEQYSQMATTESL